MRTSRGVIAVAGILLCWMALARAAGEYPLNVTLEANAKTANAAITSKVSIALDRLMEESRRTRVIEGLKYNGYPGALKVLRSLPPVGTIEVAGRKVEIRYAHEQPQQGGYRLVLVADRPSFFLTGDPEKPRAGYELTMVELIVDAKGGITGTMTGAARVKPGGDGGPVVDDFAGFPVRLEGQLRRP